MWVCVGMGWCGVCYVFVVGVLLVGVWLVSGLVVFVEQLKLVVVVLLIYGVMILFGYWKWEMVVLVEEVVLFDELWVVFGNLVVICVFEQVMLLFLDGMIFVKFVYKCKQFDEFVFVMVLGQVMIVQVMVKDLCCYVVMGGWGFGCFINGVLVDFGQYQICFVCYQVWVKNYDYVFMWFVL